MNSGPTAVSQQQGWNKGQIFVWVMSFPERKHYRKRRGRLLKAEVDIALMTSLVCTVISWQTRTHTQDKHGRARMQLCLLIEKFKEKEVSHGTGTRAKPTVIYGCLRTENNLVMQKLQPMSHQDGNRMQIQHYVFSKKATYSPRLVSQKTKAEKEKRRK